MQLWLGLASLRIQVLKPNICLCRGSFSGKLLGFFVGVFSSRRTIDFDVDFQIAPKQKPKNKSKCAQFEMQLIDFRHGFICAWYFNRKVLLNFLKCSHEFNWMACNQSANLFKWFFSHFARSIQITNREERSLRDSYWTLVNGTSHVNDKICERSKNKASNNN